MNIMNIFIFSSIVFILTLSIAYVYASSELLNSTLEPFDPEIRYNHEPPFTIYFTKIGDITNSYIHLIYEDQSKQLILYNNQDIKNITIDAQTENELTKIIQSENRPRFFNITSYVVPRCSECFSYILTITLPLWGKPLSHTVYWTDDGNITWPPVIKKMVQKLENITGIK